MNEGQPTDQELHDFHVLTNTWAQQTAEHFVQKCAGSWQTNGACGVEIPTTFKTKRAAMEAVDRLVLERSRRFRERMTNEHGG